ncbi:MAG: hypothetical protein WDO71_25455 [Bacteroidota bacterium]
MRFITVLLFAFPLWSAAQDCKLKKTIDPYTKEARLSSGLISLRGASLSMEADSKEIDFFFTMDGKEKCFNDASTAVVFYEGTKVKANFRNGGSVNCDGFFHIIFRNGPTTTSLLQKLVTQKITSIEVTGTDKKRLVISLSPRSNKK